MTKAYLINEYEVNKYTWSSSASLQKPCQTKQKMSPRYTEVFLLQVAPSQKYFKQQVKTYENLTIKKNYSKSDNSEVSSRLETVKTSDSPECNANNATKCPSPKTATGDTPQSATLPSTSREPETTEEDPGIIPDKRQVSTDDKFSGATSDKYINGSEDERENRTDEYGPHQTETETHYTDEDEQNQEETKNCNQTSVDSKQTTDNSDSSSDEEPDSIDRFLDELFYLRRELNLVEEYSTHYSDADTCDVTVVLSRRDEKEEEKITEIFKKCKPLPSHKLSFRYGCTSIIQKQSPMHHGQGGCNQEHDNNNSVETVVRPGDKLYQVNEQSGEAKYVLFTGFYRPVCNNCCQCKSVKHEESCKRYGKRYMITCAHAFDSGLSPLFDSTHSSRREVAWPSVLCQKVFVAKEKEKEEGMKQEKGKGNEKGKGTEKEAYEADLALLQVLDDQLCDGVNKIYLPGNDNYSFDWKTTKIPRRGQEVKIVDRNKELRVGIIAGTHHKKHNSGVSLQICDKHDKAITEVGDCGAVVLIRKHKCVDEYHAIGMVCGMKTVPQETTVSNAMKAKTVQTGVQSGEKETICTERGHKIDGLVDEAKTSDTGEMCFRIFSCPDENKALTGLEDIGSRVMSEVPVCGNSCSGAAEEPGHVKSYTLAVDLTQVLRLFDCEMSQT